MQSSDRIIKRQMNYDITIKCPPNYKCDINEFQLPYLIKIKGNQNEPITYTAYAQDYRDYILDIATSDYDIHNNKLTRFLKYNVAFIERNIADRCKKAIDDQIEILKSQPCNTTSTFINSEIRRCVRHRTAITKILYRINNMGHFMAFNTTGKFSRTLRAIIPKIMRLYVELFDIDHLYLPNMPWGRLAYN